MNPPDRPAPETLAIDSGEALAEARLQLLRGARRRVAIYQPALPADAYNNAAELEELRRIATSGRGAEIRILLHDAAAALRDSHRLVALAQRLPSSVLVREPVEETDRAYGSACLLTDAGGYLFLPEAGRSRGRASLEDRASQAPLQQYFQEVWERAARATVLQPLDL
ncbi:hypothetical protein ABZR86_05920 [Dyella marensis]|uniref:DUF7931 domain-containing protein n=1 Tax=Dyella marensis TaxID=500610 RepID=A0A1I1XWT7_9GAMM|nr:MULTISPECIES: hypothetical protein [Dyella]SFE11158.1 hypothetical protein SAMN02799615_00391 [Dyella marensis]